MSMNALAESEYSGHDVPVWKICSDIRTAMLATRDLSGRKFHQPYARGRVEGSQKNLKSSLSVIITIHTSKSDPPSGV
jgi:hypothetical protein